MSNGQAFAPSRPGSFRIPELPKDWFSYPVTFLAVAGSTAGTAVSTNIQIDAGSDFYLTALTLFAVISGSTATITVSSAPLPDATLLLTDSGSNRQLMNAPVPLSQIAGDGNHPHRLIHPRVFFRNSNIQVQLTSYDLTATYSRLTVNFEGFRIYGSA